MHTQFARDLGGFFFLPVYHGASSRRTRITFTSQRLTRNTDSPLAQYLIRSKLSNGSAGIIAVLRDGFFENI